MKKKNFSVGLKGKIILPVLAIIVIGMTTILYPILTIFSNSSMDLSQNLTTEIAGHNAQLLSSDINSKLAVARSLKAVLEQSAIDGSMNREEVLSCLKQVIKNNDSIYGIFTCWEPNAFDRNDNQYKNTNWHDSTGRFIPHLIKNKGSIGYHISPLENYDTDGLGNYYLLPKKTNKECILEPFYSKTNDKNYYITSIIEPLYIGYKFVGIIGIDVSLDPYVNMYDDLELYDNGYVSLFSSEGQIISHPNKDLIGSSIYDISSEDYNSKLRNVIETGNPGDFSHDEIINNKTEKSITKMIPISIGNTGLNWCIGVSAPVSEIIKPVSKGMLLGISIAGIVCILSIIILFFIIGNIVKKIYKINDDLTQSSSYVSSAATELTTTSQDLSNGANEQAASIEQTSASIEENTSMIKQSAKNTVAASQLSKKVKQSAVSGAYTIDNMISGMEELKQSSKQISNIIKVIDDIASQTNILALNAAVEAARAGDAGRGFAVVADEVRKLAQKSTEAAKNTDEIIEKNLILSSKSVKASGDVKLSLDNITTQIDKIVDLVDEIASASNEQSNSMQESSNAMIDMERIVQNNAAAAEESAAASEELQAQAHNLVSAVKELNNIVSNNKIKKDKPQKPKKTVIKKERRTGVNEMAIAGKKAHIVSPEEIIPLDEDNEF